MERGRGRREARGARREAAWNSPACRACWRTASNATWTLEAPGVHGVHELPPPPSIPLNLPRRPTESNNLSWLYTTRSCVTHVPAANCPVFRQNLKLRFVNDEQQLVSRAPRMHGGPHGLYVMSILTPCFDGDVRFRPVCGSLISERQQTPRCTRLATPLSLSLSLTTRCSTFATTTQASPVSVALVCSTERRPRRCTAGGPSIGA